MVLGGMDCNLVGEGERLGRYRLGEGLSMACDDTGSLY